MIILQVLYEFVFAKYGITAAFGIFKTLPRELVPIEDQLIGQAGIQGTLAVEESGMCPEPLAYITVTEEVCDTFTLASYRQ